MLAELSEWPVRWTDVWLPLLRDPTSEKFTAIVKVPEASMQRAMLSMLGAILIAAIAWAIILGAFIFLILLGTEVASSIYLWVALGLVLFVPLYAGLTLLGILINAVVLHFSAIYLFKGEGTFEELLYGMSLYITPITLLTTGLLFIPVLGWTIAMILGIYAIILQILALRGVYSFEWIQAIIVATVPYALNQIIVYGLYFVFIFTFLVGIVAI